MRTQQDFAKSTAYFRALIRKQMDKWWREEHQALNKGKQWLKVNVGYGGYTWA